MEMIINISLYRLLYFANTHRVKISRYRLLKDKKPDESQLSGTAESLGISEQLDDAIANQCSRELHIRDGELK